MKEKIANLMKSESLSSSRLAEILEIQPSAVSHLLSGRNKPRLDLLQKILRRFPRINPDWLLLDDEQMYRDGDELNADSQAGDSSLEPLNLFGDDGEFSLGDLLAEDMNFGQDGADSGANFMSQNERQFRGQNSANFQGVNAAQNRGNSTTQNSAQFGRKNGMQNDPNNAIKNGQQNRGANTSSLTENSPLRNPYNRPYVERVIVLYSDNTCRTYDMRK